MTKQLYHKIENPYGTRETFYYGCDTTGCRGERTGAFDSCIRHLSDDEAAGYAQQLMRGHGVLVFSELEVDADFVHAWIDRVASRDDEDGVATVRVPVMMQGVRMVDGLELHHRNFVHGIYMPGAEVYSVRIFDCQFQSVTGLNLESGIVMNQIQIHDSRFENLTMIACSADTVYLHETRIRGEFDARGLVAGRNVNFHKIDAWRYATFRDANFGGPDGGSNVTGRFQRRADFTGARFPGGVQFGSSEDRDRCLFDDEAIFDESTFGSEAAGSLTLPACSFGKAASFRNATVYGCALFDGVAFLDTANFDGLRVLKGSRGEAQLTMRKPVIRSTMTMRAEVQGTARLEDVSLPKVAEGFMISASSGVSFNRVDVEPFSVINLSSATSIVLDQFNMQNGGQLRIESCNFELTNFSSAHPVLVSGSQELATSTDGTVLTSLSGTDCDGLTFSGLDLSQAKFIGAANVDRLVVSGQFSLNSTKGWHARRKFLFEEAIYRASVGSSKQWSGSTAEKHAQSSSIEPRQLAAVYRALRKSREDQKDEPGSADFYYGEMEMRRLSTPAVSVERLVLTLYWLVSGYGLRAWRAILVLIALIVGSTKVLTRFPLVAEPHAAHPSFGKALLFSVQSSLSLAGSAGSFSTAAQIVEVVLRFGVPILLALAVLAVRARVKR